MNIAEICPIDNYMLYIKSDDGQTGLFDVKPYLDSEAFTPLKEASEFQRVHNGKYFVAWDCGADLSADTIHAKWLSATDENAEQAAPAVTCSSRC